MVYVKSKTIANSNQNNKKSNDSWSSVYSKHPFLHCQKLFALYTLIPLMPPFFKMKSYLKYITGPKIIPEINHRTMSSGRSLNLLSLSWIFNKSRVEVSSVKWGSTCTEHRGRDCTGYTGMSDGFRKCACHHMLGSVTFVCIIYIHTSK